MSKVVAAMATVHAPFITGLPQLAPEDQRLAVYNGFARLRERLAVAVEHRVEPAGRHFICSSSCSSWRA